MADNVVHESRGESFLGKILVAKTVLNRAAHPDFPRGLCEIIYQPNQYSWTLTQYKQPSKEQWTEAAYAVYAALSYPSPVLYFHNQTVKPKWALTKTLITTEGNHIFYQ